MSVLLLGRECRLNPAYRLLALHEARRAATSALIDKMGTADERGMFLVPNRPGLTVKAVGASTAELLKRRFTVHDAHLQDRGFCRALLALMLDGVLEVREGRHFVSGPRAVGILAPELEPRLGANQLSLLSYRALQYAQMLDVRDRSTLSGRLYMYNRHPITPSWHQRCGSATDTESYLGLDSATSHRRALARDWRRMARPTGGAVWFVWHAKNTLPGDHQGPTYKLYISPQGGHVQQVFASVVLSLSDTGATSFKIGNDASGLLRPDKMIAYFTNQADLVAAASTLYRRLQGCPPHGTPFTAELYADGLLSWGVDPPWASGSLSWITAASWRSWLTAKLATALVAAKADADSEVEPWRFALLRLSLDDVDTATWAPRTDSWAAEADANLIELRRNGVVS